MASDKEAWYNQLGREYKVAVQRQAGIVIGPLVMAVFLGSRCCGCSEFSIAEPRPYRYGMSCIGHEQVGLILGFFSEAVMPTLPGEGNFPGAHPIDLFFMSSL